MRRFIATVKIKQAESHHPRKKVTGRCPITISRSQCSDQTGGHHSHLVQAESLEEATEIAARVFGHVTRVEEIHMVVTARSEPHITERRV